MEKPISNYNFQAAAEKKRPKCSRTTNTFENKKRRRGEITRSTRHQDAPGKDAPGGAGKHQEDQGRPPPPFIILNVVSTGPFWATPCLI